MMCASSVNAKVVEFNSHIVAVKISEGYGDWVMVGFYGPCYASKRQKAWTNFSALAESLEDPWTCIGDFNVVIDDEEKFWDKSDSSSMPNFLKDLLLDLGAIDLGLNGRRYARQNKR
uniref:Endonuclease/exonuclease/phosphatase family protein n=1 Tax=Quercus lobata TaxID=97700 RepID=A0A7N2N2A8_QUELO